MTTHLPIHHPFQVCGLLYYALISERTLEQLLFKYKYSYHGTPSGIAMPITPVITDIILIKYQMDRLCIRVFTIHLL